jgi:rSAM/selenodomain-associated transferase 1
LSAREHAPQIRRAISHPSHRAPAVSDAILIFLRAPRQGGVKSRLAARIGAAAALAVYRRLAEHAVDAARTLAPAAAVRVHFTPADAEAEVRAWLGDGLEYLPQAEGDLGERLAAAFEEAFADGHARVLVIGSDLPGLSPEVLGEAFALLERERAVIGPALDGGYYLLGLREPPPAIFHEVPWSTGEVAAVTVARLRSEGIEPALLAPLADVDTVDDLPAAWREWALALETR